MKRAICLTFLLLSIALAMALACPANVSCPIHYSTAYFTGTRVIDGVVVGVYHCPRGHDVIARCD